MNHILHNSRYYQGSFGKFTFFIIPALDINILADVFIEFATHCQAKITDIINGRKLSILTFIIPANTNDIVKAYISGFSIDQRYPKRLFLYLTFISLCSNTDIVSIYIFSELVIMI